MSDGSAFSGTYSVGANTGGDTFAGMSGSSVVTYGIADHQYGRGTVFPDHGHTEWLDNNEPAQFPECYAMRYELSTGRLCGLVLVVLGLAVS
jgi:hypothetical protein